MERQLKANVAEEAEKMAREAKEKTVAERKRKRQLREAAAEESGTMEKKKRKRSKTGQTKKARRKS